MNMNHKTMGKVKEGFPRKRGRLAWMVTGLAFLALATCPGLGEAGVLFSSTWNAATGSSSTAINDGGKWYSGYNTAPLQYPYVSSGGPQDNNYLNMVTVGGGGWGNPYYMNWFISGGNNGDIFGDPNDLYIRCYFRVHQDWVNDVHNSNHWFVGVDNPNSKDTKHYLRFEATPGELPDVDSDWVIGMGINAVDEVYKANITMEEERWYCWEINVHRIDSTHERWYVRLDGVDITSKFMCIGGSHYGKWLGDLYAQGFSWANEYHGNLWLCTYDENTINDGWDVGLIEVRDDRWPGPITGGGTTDTTPPTGTIQISGPGGMTDRTGSTSVTLSLSASDSGSGMGTGAQMQFSNNGTLWSLAEPYAASKTWDLADIPAGTEQVRTVYVKFKDVAGNWSGPIPDTIIMDKQPPAPPLNVNIGN
jgi:hypothetical protein